MRFLGWEEGRWKPLGDLDRVEARERALGPQPLWVRAEHVPPDQWEDLGEWFDLHPLALEDLRNPRQRPKVEDYPGVTFTVMRVPHIEDDLSWRQIGLFLGEGFVMTASAESIPELDDVEKRLVAGAPLAKDGRLDAVFYHAVDRIVDAWFPFMDALEDRLEDLEDDVLDAADRETLKRVRDTKSLISRTRKVLAPMREASLNLERGDHPHLASDMRVYMRDVSDHTVRLVERLEHVREIAFVAQETWNSTLSNKQNEQMRRLTVVAALLLIPSLLAGLGGMNFEGFPGWDYWAVTGGILLFIALGFSVAAMKRLL